MAQAVLSSPIGPILLQETGGRLNAIHIGVEPAPEEPDDSPILREALSQLAAWFAGRSSRFDLPLADPSTPRGAAHREAIAAIPYGETSSYGALARMIGSSPRAIGQACRRNPFPIIIPCHRVIGTGGSMGYYSGGQGLPTKLWLLDHERRHQPKRG